MHATGDFDVSTVDVQQLDDAPGATLGQMTLAKTFRGDLAGKSTAVLLTVMDGNGDPAAYVAVERVSGALHGRTGTFVLHHTAPGTAGEPIVIRVVPGTGTGTGTGELSGIEGSLSIVDDTDTVHRYVIEYTLSDGSAPTPGPSGPAADATVTGP